MAGKCNSGKCDVFARVSDQSGLDGCGILLQLDDGSMLLPANIDAFNLDLTEGDTLSISYDVVPDAMSVCMRENATVTLTCADKVSE